MALINNTNCGFCLTAPTTDPSGDSNIGIDGMATAGKYTAPATGVVNEIGFWCDTASEEANFEVGLFSHDSGNNRPLSLIAGSSQTNAKGTDAGWKKATVSIPVTKDTIYWITFQLDNVTTSTNSDYTLAAGEKLDNKVGTTFPTSWGSSAGSAAGKIAAYAAYTATATTPIKLGGGWMDYKKKKPVVKEEIKSRDAVFVALENQLRKINKESIL